MPPKRTRRTAEQIIADLKAEIERIKARASQQKIKKDPALRNIAGAVRAIDKAMVETKDKATRTALMEARVTLSACLTLNGAVPAGGRGTLIPKSRAVGRPDANLVLDYIRKHPGSRSGEICGELGVDALRLRPVLHRLRDEGKIKVKGNLSARFTDEAQLAGQLDNSGIIPVYDLGQDEEGRLFFTTRLVKGRTLDRRTASACLPLRRAWWRWSERQTPLSEQP